MNFETPTTKAEMYETLKNIYTHYRFNVTEFSDLDDVENLELERISFSPLTDEQLSAKAEALVISKIEREKREQKEKVEDELNKLSDKIDAINEKYEEYISSINNRYENLIDKLRKESYEKGLSYSSFSDEKLIELEKEKSDEINERQAEKFEKISELEGKISAYTEKLEGIDDYYDNLFELDKQAKFLELKADQDKTEMEVFKYNNGIDEKEKRYDNTNQITKANLKIRFLEIKSKGLTKEDLVDVGYFKDVLDCATSYYETMSAISAFNDIKNETGLITYLEDYYQDFVYLFKVRAQS